MNEEDSYFVEYGCISNIRFVKPEQAVLRNLDGEIAMCKCGKVAAGGVFGKDAFLLWCNDCSPLDQKACEFVYRPPK